MIQTEGNMEETMFETNKFIDNKVSEKHSLFLGDLSIYCDEKDIAAAFAPYGNIVDIRIQRSKETSRALSYGFIEFDTEESAAVALREMNYFLLKGRPLRIRWAAGRTTPIKSTTTPHDSAATVYVRFLTLEDNIEITEESLRTLFNQYGPVFDCAIKKLAPEQKGTRIKGYAFVSFDSGALAKGTVDVIGVEAALRVCTELRNRVVDNVRYRCELGNRLQKQAASMSLAPALMPAVVACAPLGGCAPVPSVMYVSPDSQPPPSQGYQQPVSYQPSLSSASTDGSCPIYSPPLMMSPYSSNPSTPTNHQLRMAQLAQQQQQLQASYQQQHQQYQQSQYRAPHPGYTPVPTPTHSNTAPAGTALQVLQQQPQGLPQPSPVVQQSKHPQDPSHPHIHVSSQGHGPSHTTHHGSSQSHNNSNSNYQAQLLAQAQAQLHAQALAQAAFHAQAQQTQQVQQLQPVLASYPAQYAQSSPPQQLPLQAVFVSRGHSGYNSGAATPVSNARLAAQQQGNMNMQNMQMVNTPEGVMMMVPVTTQVAMPLPGPPQGMLTTGYPPFMTAQQAYTPRAYTPTAYAQQQVYMHPGSGSHTPRGSLLPPQHPQHNQHSSPPQQYQSPPSQLALQQHATQQQGILKELSCSQYFAQKGIRLTIKTTTEETPSTMPMPVPRSYSADNTPREAYLQRKLNSTPRRSQYNNTLYTNYNNSGSNSNLYNERGPVSRRGSNDSVNTTSLYIGDLSIEEGNEYAESGPNSSGRGEYESTTPTTATTAATEV